MKATNGNLVKLFVFLVYWTIEIGALQYHILNRARSLQPTGLRNPSIVSHSGDCPRKVQDRFPKPYSPKRLKDAVPFEKSALFSSSTASDLVMEEGNKQGGFIAKLRWLMLLPFRLLVLYPLKFVAELVVDDLNDGTVEDADPVLPNETEPSSTGASAYMTSKAEAVSGNAPVNNLKADGEASKTAVQAPVQTTDSAQKAVQAKNKEALSKPVGDRWATCAPGVDLSGKWQMIASDEFKAEYDRYLTDLGQPLLVRTVAVSIIDRTTEELTQSEDGKSLLIRGRNIRGVWDRTLVASGAEVGVDNFTPLQVPVMTADSEKVEAESWWENEGKMHISWLRGVKKYGGGAFESKRYLEDDGQVYVCESIYHPDDTSLNKLNTITWRFRRQPESA